MKLMISIALFAISLASPCFAINPLMPQNSVLPKDTNRWKMIYLNPPYCAEYVDSENYRSYINEYNIAHSSCRMISSWFWRVSFQNDNTLILKDTYTISFMICDLNCKTIDVRRVVEYDKNGKCLGDFEYNDLKEKVIPNSVGEEFLKYLKYYDEHK